MWVIHSVLGDCAWSLPGRLLISPAARLAVLRKAMLLNVFWIQRRAGIRQAGRGHNTLHGFAARGAGGHFRVAGFAESFESARAVRTTSGL